MHFKYIVQITTMYLKAVTLIYGSKYLNHKRVQSLHLKPLGSKDYVTDFIDKQGKPMIWVVFDKNCQILPTQGREPLHKFIFFSDARAPGSKK